MRCADARAGLCGLALTAGLLLLVPLLPARAADEQVPAPAQASSAPAAGGEEDATGTDPRAFGSKFMPYWRYTDLENDLRSWQFTLFGLVRLADWAAMTYEVPIAKETDISDVDAFKRGTATETDPELGSGTINTVPRKIASFGPDGETFGIGDPNFRFFAKNERFRFRGPFREDGQIEFMGGFETTLPLATKDALGDDTWMLSPMFIYVMDMPLPFSFMALMNFYDFDIHKKGGGGGDVSRFRGRWFYMQPLTPPGDQWWSGLYLLPELQPVYDFRQDEFSFWIGPELGKILRPGRLIYLKPGWGISADSNERDFTFELGLRWFF